ncbi:alkane 1-monooxygenase [Sandaracinomonas limnophila]|uniref:Alkane 1-monooxygenase n=1 Tax=Sandaracinomonas limnophila TaxID=1862386 RepID=A0A437PPS4_9BACT|nr:alkane 1-monooxygenase [Sandaracinomonas limnophila]RVU24104.1 alkane 1-monooxygenase [Sandaracinomonas limnophila]
MIKYYTPFLLFFLAGISFFSYGIAAWAPLIFIFFIIPGLELFIKPDPQNLDPKEEELAKNNKGFDFVIYAAAVGQFISLCLFFRQIQEPGIGTSDILARIISMGLLCAIFGINLGHELGHRVNKFEQTLAKLLLLTSLYMQFFIDHNKGHHSHVGTPNDPSSAKLNQSIYAFYLQTFIGTYLSAWKISLKDCKKKGKKSFSIHNEMLQFQFIQLAFLWLIYYLFGPAVMFYFMLSAFIGSILLESINYIEHYGLSRIQKREAIYERVQPWHSWNSNHQIGRLMLFELSRHSDHHYLASRKYQILRHIETAPQMPTGYPGMILLALIPPLWFRIMNKKIKTLSQKL